ncbi:hypothetical protein B1A99_01640 [Cohnella sp. CIP 111063]|jgi:hypothetical protein|uniref:hypothetical protein n=1 Tax=unclassified Cohnella TaxID=2636738 RepID=UPI000B8C6806|nr:MULTISPECIES: hypothetical protein [unclassified Cohnella]OXS62588.1 hypothetical protein B1A99_01640 [Cohnella sp. CIP 111063]PRX74841.1 hypothetical protein B0G52_101335 [Cohnella sp. SGD-V74]
MNTEATLIFIISSFSLAVVLILTRDRLPDRMRRPMAILSIVLVLFAFFLIVYNFFIIGS